jgi:hypothetical protein
MKKKNRAIVIHSPRYWGKYSVKLPNGTIIDCHNLRTALDTATTINESTYAV